jgi:type IV pilus assembly protein PilA
LRNPPIPAEATVNPLTRSGFMISKIRKRLRNEEKGFTLIELLVVVIILGILTAIAIPSYLSFTGRAKTSAAKANLRSFVPDVESYFADNGTYATMTLAGLKTTYDQSLNTAVYSIVSKAANTYCVSATDKPGGAIKFYKAGPAAEMTSAACT